MTIKHYIEDLDVDGVDLVGDPANRRPFAVIKNLSGRRRPVPPTEGAMKRADLIAKLQKNEAVELTASELVDLVGRDVVAKAIAAGDGGRDILLQALDKAEHFDSMEACMAAGKSHEECQALMKSGKIGKRTGATDDATLTERITQTIRKLFGGDPSPETRQAQAREVMLKSMPAEARAYVEALEGQVSTLAKGFQELKGARDGDVRQALEKRAQALKDRGVTIDVAKATEVEIAAHEAAQAQVDKALEGLGIRRTFGGSTSGERGAVSARAEVAKAVVELLGHEPIDKAEEARAKRRIYQANPGLLDAIRREEREELEATGR